MYEVVVTRSDPPSAVRQRAHTLLTNLLITQASLLLPGIKKQRDYVLAKVQEEPRKSGRMWKVDLQRAESLLQSVEDMLDDPEAAAAVRLDPLLRLIDGPVSAIELAPNRLGARILPEMARGRAVRVLLEPDQSRRRRVHVEEFDPENHRVVQNSGPRCYGEVGHSYISWALNRMDLSTLILATVAYLRDN